ncbi:MAG: hypothetical protein H6738_02690 [Alphaproteobacteria bacterium]|nr:hypothetical protein [Alphaproteobacteria bacterium]MCB9695677.1 hypothetical protein [Alphaproteobacteria bacterium]
MPATLPTEAQLFRSSWDDGLLDLLVGIGLLATGLSWQLDLVPLAVVVGPMAAAGWAPLRRRYVEPRAGWARFTASRRRRSSRLLGLSVAAGVGVFALVATLAVLQARGVDLPGRSLVDAVPALLVAPLGAFTSALTGARRFLAWGGVLVALGLGTVVVGAGPWMPLVGAGVLMLVAGAARFRRFLAVWPEEP